MSAAAALDINDFSHLRRGRPVGGQYTGGLDSIQPAVFVQCIDCRLGISEQFVQAAVPETPSFHARTYTTHVSCFKCWRCSEKLGDEYFVKNDRLYCAKHGEGGIKGLAPTFGDVRGQVAAATSDLVSRCGNCHRDLSGADVAVASAKNASGQEVSFHLSCFQCLACKVGLESGYALVEGQVHCIECAQSKLDVQVRRRIEESVQKARGDAARRFAEEEEKLDAARQQRIAALRAQAQAALNLLGGAGIAAAAGGACEVCRGDVPAAASVAVGAGVAHQACLNCSKCQQAFDKLTFGVVQPDNTRVCHGCAGRKTCPQCNQVIRANDAGCSAVAGKHVHEHCAVCFGCWQPLSDAVKSRADGHLVCGECA